MVVDPRAVADRHPDPATRALTGLAVDVTERPWALTGADLDRVRSAGLDDAVVLHAVLQASLFGHLNRIADAVGVACDYPDSFGAPHIEAATPPYLWPTSAPDPTVGRPIDLDLRPGTTDALSAWRTYALEREAPLTRRQRRIVASAVAVRLGDAAVERVEPNDPLEEALVELADTVTLAPWRLGPSAYDRLRGLGLADDADVFDAVATASSCTVFSRIAATLTAFGRSPDNPR